MLRDIYYELSRLKGDKSLNCRNYFFVVFLIGGVGRLAVSCVTVLGNISLTIETSFLLSLLQSVSFVGQSVVTVTPSHLQHHKT